MTAPEPSRPYVPDYGIPESEEGMLPWSHVLGRLTESLHYWVCTVDAGGRPHATPVWGVVLDGTLYFDGSPETRRGRNMAANPAVSVHLESGTDVVILHGEAREIHGAGQDFYVRLAASYSSKYKSLGYDPSPDTWAIGGLYSVAPRTAFAWTSFPEDATRWRFDAPGER